MCNFFSFVSDGHGKVYYFDYSIRKQIISGKLNYETDSHTSIADYFGFKGGKEDNLNKWEYNPLTNKLVCDQLNTINDRELIQHFVNNLDFKTIIPELIIKPIINPFTDIQVGACLPDDVKLLKKWVSVRNSVRDFVRDSVWDSVRDSVRDFVRDSVWDSVRDSVWDSVRDSVWDSVGVSVWGSVRDSVRDSAWDSAWDSALGSVWDSVWDSAWVYFSSFFSLKTWKIKNRIKKKNPFQPCIGLWEKGLVASFDSYKWRLHGVKGKILWEGKL